MAAWSNRPAEARSSACHRQCQCTSSIATMLSTRLDPSGTKNLGPKPRKLKSGARRAGSGRCAADESLARRCRVAIRASWSSRAVPSSGASLRWSLATRPSPNPQKNGTTAWRRVGRGSGHQQAGGCLRHCDAVRGLKPCGRTTSGTSRASHWPAAAAGAGRRPGSLRPPPPGTDHAVPLGSAARRDFFHPGRKRCRRRPAAVRQRRA